MIEPTEAMIEAVARGLCVHNLYDPDQKDRKGYLLWQEWEDEARAACTALLSSLQAQGMVVVDENDMRPSKRYFSQCGMFRVEPEMHGWVAAINEARASLLPKGSS